MPFSNRCGSLSRLKRKQWFRAMWWTERTWLECMNGSKHATAVLSVDVSCSTETKDRAVVLQKCCCDVMDTLVDKPKDVGYDAQIGFSISNRQRSGCISFQNFIFCSVVELGVKVPLHLHILHCVNYLSTWFCNIEHIQPVNIRGLRFSLSLTLDSSPPCAAPEPQPQCDLHPGLSAERRPERSERGEIPAACLL